MTAIAEGHPFPAAWAGHVAAWRWRRLERRLATRGIMLLDALMRLERICDLIAILRTVLDPVRRAHEGRCIVDPVALLADRDARRLTCALE